MSLILDGSQGVTLPSGVNGGNYINSQYFTSGTATYTPTTGTNFVIVEVVGGGGGTTGNGGTSSFGSLVSATGGIAASGTRAGGTGSGGDVNISGTSGGTKSLTTSGESAYIIGGSSFLGNRGLGAGDYNRYSISAVTVDGGGGGGYARKKITSGFSGQTVTVGAIGAGTGVTAATAGIVIVHEFS